MYYLTQFGTVTLPIYNVVHQIDVAPANNAGVPTIGGGFDRFGTATAGQQFPQTVSCNFAVYDETGVDATRVAFDLLRSKIGQRDQLYRTAQDTGAEQQWCWARIVSMPTTRQIDQWGSQPATLNFELWSPWYGANAHGVPWTLDSGVYFDDGEFFDIVAGTATLASSPGTLTVTNGGQLPVTDAIVTLTAGTAAAITAVDIRCGSAHLTYAGTVAAGKALVIDAGAWSVTNDGANAFSGFTFGTAHAVAGMLTLAPGSNSLVVTFTGGGTTSTVAAAFAEQFA